MGRLQHLSILIILLLACTLSFSQSVISLNPYKSVDWDSQKRYKANFHTHTTLSDGREDPNVMIDEYINKGFDILAITDHNNNTWPWTNWNRDPANLDIMAVRGVEASRHDHSNSFFMDYEGDYSEMEQSLQTVNTKGGLSQINHPGRYNRSDAYYQNLIETYPLIFGVEVYNQGDRYSGDRDRWDNLLTALMPDRPIWALSNDDSHSLGHVGRNYQMMLIPGALNENSLRNSLTMGEFYAVYDMSGDGSNAAHPDSVMVTSTEITVYPTSLANNVRWISEGQEVHQGTSIDLQTVSNLGNYVRPVLRGNNGARTLLQPFGLVDSVFVTVNNIHRIDFEMKAERINSQTVQIRINIENPIQARVSDVKGNIVHVGRVSKFKPLEVTKADNSPQAYVFTLGVGKKSKSKMIVLP